MIKALIFFCRAFCCYGSITLLVIIKLRGFFNASIEMYRSSQKACASYFYFSQDFPKLRIVTQNDYKERLYP